MRQGSVRHAVLERTLTLLRERTGSARLAPERVEAALDALQAAMREHSSSVHGAARRAAARRMHADLERYVRLECESGAGYEPERLEWRFGDVREGDEPVDLGGGLRFTGRVDRVDVQPGGRGAIVRDYKGARVAAGATWERDGNLQAALYALAVRERLGVEPVAALYQPLAGPDLRPRGLVRADTPGSYVNGDAVEPDEFAAQLDRLRALAADAAEALRSGTIRACPETCSSRGCAHPGICRAGEPKAEEETP
jgi:RecB family exonuclease